MILNRGVKLRALASVVQDPTWNFLSLRSQGQQTPWENARDLRVNKMRSQPEILRSQGQHHEISGWISGSTQWENARDLRLNLRLNFSTSDSVKISEVGPPLGSPSSKVWKWCRLNCWQFQIWLSVKCAVISERPTAGSSSPWYTIHTSGFVMSCEEMEWRTQLSFKLLLISVEQLKQLLNFDIQPCKKPFLQRVSWYPGVTIPVLVSARVSLCGNCHLRRKLVGPTNFYRENTVQNTTRKWPSEENTNTTINLSSNRGCPCRQSKATNVCMFVTLCLHMVLFVQTIEGDKCVHVFMHVLSPCAFTWCCPCRQSKATNVCMFCHPVPSHGVVYKAEKITILWVRPYQHDSTASRLLSEVKHARARLVLRWGTTLESRVLYSFFSFFFIFFHFPYYWENHRGELS